MKKRRAIAPLLAFIAVAYVVLMPATQRGPSIDEFAKYGPHFWLDHQPYYHPHPLRGQIKSFGTEWTQYHFRKDGYLFQVIQLNYNSTAYGKQYERRGNTIEVKKIYRWKNRGQYVLGDKALETCQLKARDEQQIRYECDSRRVGSRSPTQRVIHYQRKNGLLSVHYDGKLYKQRRFARDGRWIEQREFPFSHTNKGNGPRQVIVETFDQPGPSMRIATRNSQIVHDKSWWARNTQALSDWWNDTRQTPPPPLVRNRAEVHKVIDRDQRQNPTAIWRIDTVKSAATRISYDYWPDADEQ